MSENDENDFDPDDEFGGFSDEDIAAARGADSSDDEQDEQDASGEGNEPSQRDLLLRAIESARAKGPAHLALAEELLVAHDERVAREAAEEQARQAESTSPEAADWTDPTFRAAVVALEKERAQKADALYLHQTEEGYRADGLAESEIAARMARERSELEARRKEAAIVAQQGVFGQNETEYWLGQSPEYRAWETQQFLEQRSRETALEAVINDPSYESESAEERRAAIRATLRQAAGVS